MKSALAKKETNGNDNIVKSVTHGSGYEIDLENTFVLTNTHRNMQMFR